MSASVWKFPYRRQLTMLAVLALLFYAATLLLFRQPQTLRVTATFLSFTNATATSFTTAPPVGFRSYHSNYIVFSLSNHSSRFVHYCGSSFRSLNPYPGQWERIDPYSLMEILVPRRSFENEVKLHFRRQDTPVEEARERLDSVLKTIRVRWPGLNPDSSANFFIVRAEIPSEVKSIQR
jgi:hypothetical protein